MRRLGQLYARISVLDIGGSTGSKMLLIFENGNHRARDPRERSVYQSKNRRFYLNKVASDSYLDE